ncbi:hypothetical protein HRbin40_01512 [bacterium HR40]|nr:hypothetical protein HRbin40_01512 [bacterium HR40]
MAVGGWLRRLLGTGAKRREEREPVTYGEYTITPTPLAQGGQFVTAGIIRKHTAQGMLEHRFVRADTHATAEDAAEFAIHKGRQIIDQLGDRIFES